MLNQPLLGNCLSVWIWHYFIFTPKSLSLLNTRSFAVWSALFPFGSKSSSKSSSKTNFDSIKFLNGVFEFAQKDIIPGGSKRNLEYLNKNIYFNDTIAEFQKLMLADAQTSGGLLISCPEDRSDELLKVLSWDMNAFKIGYISEKEEKTIRVNTTNGK